MNTFTVVRQEHLNHHGYLFGGQLLKWVDEYAWLTAARDFTDRTLVTRALDSVDFRTRVEPGSILRFEILPSRIGRSSVAYRVEVWADAPGSAEEIHVLSVSITFVAVDDDGKPRVIPR
ncbi:MAG: acyl-CoA thioesterase [Candidatus Competibacteraceae bacterium]|nr:acyl-CoA thioesterase [Candidatus Competibacteraceae bacterium]